MNLNETKETEQAGLNAEQQTVAILKQPVTSTIQPPEPKPRSFGQRLADTMATKVGSWGFLIGQSAVLTGWVGFNLIPGLPHWDQSPFILLNLVFSFASAYTAPVVLMSQNRQSEEDRENAHHNYRVTLQAAQNIEMLREKLDAEYTQKLDDLTALIKQQQQAAGEVKVVFIPTHAGNQETLNYQPVNVSSIPALTNQAKGMVLVNVGDNQSPYAQLKMDEAKVLVK
jgi:uncharacterized membrane protein